MFEQQPNPQVEPTDMKKPKILILSRPDRVQASILLQAGVLRPFQATDLAKHTQFRTGFVLIGCSDGSVSRNIHSRCYKICRDLGATPCVHCVQNGGGGLLVSPTTPIPVPELTPKEIGAFCKHQISIGVLVKQLPAILLTGHAPCAAATDANLDLIGQVQVLMEGKEEIRRQYPRGETVDHKHVVIVPAILLQFSQRDTRLFFIHIESWRKHLATLAEWRENSTARKRGARSAKVGQTPASAH